MEIRESNGKELLIKIIVLKNTVSELNRAIELHQQAQSGRERVTTLEEVVGRCPRREGKEKEWKKVKKTRETLKGNSQKKQYSQDGNPRGKREKWDRKPI